MTEKKGFLFNVGIPSILLILLSFALSVFAMLSIGASSSEQKLAEKTGESIREYYQADQKAEYVLCYMDALLETVDAEHLEEMLVGMEASQDAMLKDVENVSVELEKNGGFSSGKAKKIGMVSFGLPMTEKSTLQVELAIYSDRSYQVTRWNTQVEDTNVYELEDGEELWDGVTELE